MATKKKLIELDEKTIEILKKQAKLQKRSLKNYIEYFLEDKASCLAEPSEAYKKMMDEMIEKYEKGTAKTISHKEVMARYGR